MDDQNEVVYSKDRGEVLARKYFDLDNGNVIVVECLAKFRKAFLRHMEDYTAADATIRMAGSRLDVDIARISLPWPKYAPLESYGSIHQLSVVDSLRLTVEGAEAAKALGEGVLTQNGIGVRWDVEFCGGDFAVLNLDTDTTTQMQRWEFLSTELSGKKKTGFPDFLACGMRSNYGLLALFDKHEMRELTKARGLRELSLVNWECGKNLLAA